MEEFERERVINWRREFHRNPEPGWMEYRTSAVVAQTLREAGYQVYAGQEIIEERDRMAPPDREQQAAYRKSVEALGGYYGEWVSRMGEATGVIGIYDSGKAGQTVAFRCDMDALYIRETDNPQHKPKREGFSSLREGVFHGCGHDGHTAALLGLAEWLMGERACRTGRLIFIFQPAEEGVRGANAIVKNWRFGNIDKLFCFHIGFAGEDEFVAGAVDFLATTKIDVTFIGKGVHAGLAPNRGKNALLAAASTCLQLYGIARHEEGATRINVGSFHAGTSRNSICDRAVLQLETRGENSKLNDYMLRETLRMISGNAVSYDVTAAHQVVGSSEGASSSEALSGKVLMLAEHMKRYRRYTLHKSFGASDDGAVFMNMVQRQGGQAVYLLFGTTICGKHHEKEFDFQEDVLVHICDTLHEVYNSISREG